MDLSNFKRNAREFAAPFVAALALAGIGGTSIKEAVEVEPEIPAEFIATLEPSGAVEVPRLSRSESNKLRDGVSFVEGVKYTSDPREQDRNRENLGRAYHIEGTIQIPAPNIGECAVVTSTAPEGFADVRASASSNAVGDLTSDVTFINDKEGWRNRSGKASGDERIEFDATSVEICNNDPAQRTSSSNSPTRSSKTVEQPKSSRVFIEFKR